MASHPRILAVITARSGSKRLPGKNIRALAGKPLLAWSIAAAQVCTTPLHGIIISTDDEEIAEVGRKFGADVPFLRPEGLATDTAGSLEVVQHSVQYVEARDGVKMDWVLLLQPTSPLRTASDIDAACRLAQERECDSVISVMPMPVHPMFAKRLDGEGFLQPFGEKTAEHIRRQDAKPDAYTYNGAIYLTRRDTLVEQGSFYGKKSVAYIMPHERSVDVDMEWDFKFAELLLEGV